MTSCAYMTRVTIMVLTLACGNFLSNPAGATSLAAHPISQEAGSKEAPKDEVVKKYLATCRAKPAKQAECDAVKKEAIDILQEDLRTLGSSANPIYLPVIYNLFNAKEPEMRIAAADAVGMIGPPESGMAHLVALANDPVPDVRKAAS